MGILGSGAGSNMTAIDDACRRGLLSARIVLVISDVAQAGILSEAARRDLPHVHIPPGAFRTKLEDAAEAEYIRRLQDAGVEWVVLAGFMRIVRSAFLGAFPDRMVNVHPSLLPSFPGLDAAAQALEYGVCVTGTTIHMVDRGIDTGPILAQEPVPVEEDDTPRTLQRRIRQAEHRLYPRVLQELVTGRIRIRGGRVVRTPRT